MIQGIKNGWRLIKDSVKVFNHHPKFLIPLLFVWMIYAPIILYWKFGINWDLYSDFQFFTIVFAVIFLFAFLLSFSCLVLLELIQQLESGHKMSLVKAFNETVTKNILKTLPIILVWTVIWFILLILQALSKKEKADEREGYSVENAAKALAGYGDYSVTGGVIDALQKGVRMIVFLILPGIAWENLDFLKAVKKGTTVFKVHLSEFVSGFVLTELAAIVIFLPASIVFYLAYKWHVPFPDPVWVGTIIYTAFAWSYSIYLEQMFTAELYLWNRKWEKQIEEDKRLWKTLSNLKDVDKPSVLDEVHELFEKT